ncbi:hypothetical protein [Methylobacterium iners]|uniref:Transposase DDE domain-containing protein n=2 Tax=Methylobacterium iners TaxID=418707 RepID=A0ABQ4RXX0_9HYPH|nr:hypothetical protein [Methylobacterium iners]GJD95691.1 hypothetical protein OCOJLMKI_2905 [Methylobacterium iners]
MLGRWQRGALERFFRHGGMLFRPRDRRIGTVGFGHVLIVDVLGFPADHNLRRLRGHQGWGAMARVGFRK